MSLGVTHFMTVSPTVLPSSSSRFFVVIPCAGSGSRAGTIAPKQYQPIAGVPMVLHTLRAFSQVSRLAGGVLVVSPDDTQMQALLRTHPQALFQLAAVGGGTRAASVLAGLHQLVQQGAQADDWVLVHDAARCLITPEQIDHLITMCEHDAVGGLLAVRLADTLKSELAGRVAVTVDRSDKWLAQTPQMFRLALLIRAMEQAGPQVTDEASAIEHLGLSPCLVEASAHNFKVTYPQDFALAQALLGLRNTQETS